MSVLTKRVEEFEQIRISLCARKIQGIFVRPEIELYNLVEDPEEKNNIANEFPELTKFFSDDLDLGMYKINGRGGSNGTDITKRNAS